MDAVGVPFTQVESGDEDSVAGKNGAELAVARAVNKAERAELPTGMPAGYFLLSADTMVVVEGVVLGKPKDEEEAEDMLGLLGGRTHQVVSGVALLRIGEGGTRMETGLAETSVRFRSLTGRDMRNYVATKEWEGKAGGYAIQGTGALLVESIAGEYSNVVGLPLRVVLDLFRGHGFDLMGGTWLS